MVGLLGEMPIWPGVWPWSGTILTSPAAVSARLSGNGPYGSGSSSSTVGSNQFGKRRLGVAAEAPATPRSDLEVAARDEDLGVGKVVEPTRVVGVQVREHDRADVAGRMPSPFSCGPISSSGATHSRQAVAEERVPSREVFGLGGARALAGIDHDHAFGMLDGERVDRERLRPLPVEEHVEQAAKAMADSFDLACLDRHGSGLDRVDLLMVAPSVCRVWPRGEPGLARSRAGSAR